MSGLGRVSVCMMEVLATHNVPAVGYGLRYEFGSFTQKINEEGEQIEVPDYWVSKGIPWEIPRQDVCYSVGFGGRVIDRTDSPSEHARIWQPDE